MTWNYRLVKRKYEVKDEIVIEFGIHEAYYGEDGEVESITSLPSRLVGESDTGLYHMVEKMKGAFFKEILRYEDF